jgi:hypothetical protein
MGQRYIKESRIMITVELQELFDGLKSDLMTIKTDLVIMKYTLEQIEAQLENHTPSDPDPFAGQTLHKL